MPSLTWASAKSDNAGGAQRYEEAIQAALLAVADPSDWTFKRAQLTGLRTPGRGGRRVPMGLLDRASLSTARALGRLAYPRGLVHRFDLRLPPAGLREVATVHGLEPWHFTDEGLLPPWLEPATRESFGCIAVSEFTASELRSRLDIKRIWVIPNGVDESWRSVTSLSAEERAGLGLQESYVLHAAGASARKNLPPLAAAWPEVHSRTQAQLVMTGSPDPRRTALFEGLPGAKLLGRVDYELLQRIMAGAAVVVVPSLYEGFGLPAIEAMACGVPVVASSRAALPEVCGEAAVLVDPDAVGLVNGLLTVLENPELARRLRVAGRERATAFSWTASAKSHLKAYQELSGAVPDRGASCD